MADSSPTNPSGIDTLVREAAWENERTVNKIRAAYCLLMACNAIGYAFVSHMPIFPGDWMMLGWGLLAVAGIYWLRRHYHPFLPYLLSTADILLFLFGLHSVYKAISVLQPAEAGTILHGGLVANALLLVAVNTVRYSPGVAIWNFILAYGLNFALVYRESGMHPSLGFEFIVFLGILGLVVISSRRFREALLKLKEREALARFLPATAVERVARDPTVLGLGGEEQHCAILFTDIRGFTKISSKQSPEETVKMLNEYFEEMVDELFRHEGVLDKFIGDGMCAIFGPPVSSKEQCRRAVQCGLGMLERLQTLNQRRKARQEKPLAIGIGIHWGPVLAGNIGSPLRMEYTHIGDAMNTCSRIEGLTKELGHSLLISQEVQRLLGKDKALALKRFPGAKVKGKSKKLVVYGVGRA